MDKLEVSQKKPSANKRKITTESHIFFILDTKNVKKKQKNTIQ